MIDPANRTNISSVLLNFWGGDDWRPRPLSSHLRSVVAIYALAATLIGCGDSENEPPNENDATELADSRTDIEEESLDPASPDEWKPLTGSGVPAVTFTDDDLFENCAFLDVGELSPPDHHNLAVMFDGYLVLPVAPEFGGGGLTFWDISEPCQPLLAGSAGSDKMRETHSLGFTTFNGQTYASTAYLKAILEFDEETGQLVAPGGFQLWNVTDPTDPKHVSNAEVPDHLYPDAYARVVLSTAVQGAYVFVGQADAGVRAFDISDPNKPVLIGSYQFDPILRVGQIQVIGNLLIATGAETPDTAFVDVTDPTEMRLLPNGRFQTYDSEGEVRDFYFSNMVGGFVYYARKESGGGVIVYDIRDPSNPKYAGDYASDGNGGYVFVHEGLAFVGESRFGAIYDVSDPTDITPLDSRFQLTGDLDTVTPLGNLAVVSVDDDADPDQGSAISPWSTTPDTNAPIATWSQPLDGATDFPLTGRVGVSFNEMVEPKSVFRGSFKLYDADSGRQIEGIYSVQETIVNFAPTVPLETGRTYRLEVPVGGIIDFSGNAVAEPFTIEFSTED